VLAQAPTMAQLPTPAQLPMLLHSPARHIATQAEGSARGSPRMAGRRQSPCLRMLAQPPKYFQGTSNLNPWLASW